jgi:hypothetical protein
LDAIVRTAPWLAAGIVGLCLGAILLAGLYVWIATEQPQLLDAKPSDLPTPAGMAWAMSIAAFVLAEIALLVWLFAAWEQTRWWSKAIVILLLYPFWALILLAGGVRWLMKKSKRTGTSWAASWDWEPSSSERSSTAESEPSAAMARETPDASPTTTTRSIIRDESGTPTAVRETTADGRRSVTYEYDKGHWIDPRGKPMDVTDHHKDGTSTSYEYDRSHWLDPRGNRK